MYHFHVFGGVFWWLGYFCVADGVATRCPLSHMVQKIAALSRHKRQDGYLTPKWFHGSRGWFSWTKKLWEALYFMWSVFGNKKRIPWCCHYEALLSRLECDGTTTCCSFELCSWRHAFVAVELMLEARPVEVWCVWETREINGNKEIRQMPTMHLQVS